MKRSNKKGHFITFEGGEGSGKTTLLHQLAVYLSEKGYEVITTREPGGTLLGETVREWVLNRDQSFSISNQAELLLFLAARAQHIHEKIVPALEAGTIVLCDRFNESTIAYQGGARGLGIDFVKNLCNLVCGDVQPGLTFYLDVAPELGISRSKSVTKQEAHSGELDRIESENLTFHYKIKDVFDALIKADPQRIYRIDASLPQDKVFSEAICLLDELVLRPFK